jgi:CsoR family transcriptional regulator, copper-sensing transcriptional repressor
MAEVADPVNERAAIAERRFAMPVILAAVASVPATFLTMAEGRLATAGAVVNAATMVVFVAEAVVLFSLAEDRRAWVRRHRFVIGITVATIPAVLLALGPVQVLRLLRVVRAVGAIRILRVRRLLKAGRILRTRAGLEGPAWRVATALLTVAGAVFVAVVLSDPTSTTRQVLDGTLQRFGPIAVLAAGGLLAGATFVVARNRRHSSAPGMSLPSSGYTDGDEGSEDARSHHRGDRQRRHEPDRGPR